MQVIAYQALIYFHMQNVSMSFRPFLQVPFQPQTYPQIVLLKGPIILPGPSQSNN